MTKKTVSFCYEKLAPHVKDIDACLKSNMGLAVILPLHITNF